MTGTAQCQFLPGPERDSVERAGRTARSSSLDAARLASILAGPLPELPAGDTRQVVGEVREMSSPTARALWLHPGWAALIAWITGQVPDCDPVVPGVHALRRAPSVRRDPMTAAGVAGYLVRAARHSPTDRGSERTLVLGCDPVDTSGPLKQESDSLSVEVAHLFGQAGITPCPAAWDTISAAIDIAVDWWNGFATNTGMTGEVLVAAARNTAGMCSEWRLRRHLRGRSGRPLVALLLGGDQWGRSARRACECEASLVLWALQMRRARLAGEPAPVPAAPIVRAWATTVRLIDEAVTGWADPGPDDAPRVAA